MAEAAAIAACLILAALAIFQISLVIGVPLGRYAWGGTQDVLPASLRVASLSSLVIYALCAIILLDASGITSIIDNEEMMDVAPWVVAGYFGLSVMLNTLSRSRAERNVMAPVSAVLAVLAVIVAVSS